MTFRLLLILLLLMLVACGSNPSKRQPAPVESRTDSPAAINPVADETTTRVYAYRAPQPQSILQPSQPGVPTKPSQPSIQALPLAADNLRKRAKAQQQISNYAAAAASLERSLRIAPRSATLWHELAALRAQQKRYAEVEQLAAKSNALAGNQYDLKNKNWQLIAQARTAQGNHEGAAYARQQVGRWHVLTNPNRTN